MSRKSRIFYWVITGLLAFGMLAQGIAQTFHVEGYVATMAHLGYPTYLLTIIGIWKILGVITILLPRMAVAKEWAYAGFVFVMSGALFSHIAAGDDMVESIPAIVLLMFIFASWYLRPRERKILANG